MSLNLIIYLVEIIVLAIAILVGFIMYKINHKHKKIFFKFFEIAVGIFIFIIGTTFIIEKPNINSEDVIVFQVNENNAISAPSAMYHFQNVTDNVKINGDINYHELGEYYINFEVDTLLGPYTKPSKVIIVDTKQPEITLEGGDEYTQSYAKEYEEPGFKAIDNYEGDITDKVEIQKENIDENNFVITYKVKDSSGNECEKSRKVKIIDDVPPEISLKGNANTTVYLGKKYEENGASATDEKDGDLTNVIQIEGTVDTSKEGEYTITYKVADNSGNESTKNRIVTVKKEPVIRQGNINNSGKKVIYLTFDDGPSSYTNELLDVLKKYNVKATFFVTGNGSDAVIKRAYDEGHTIALHTNSHNYSYVYSSTDNFFKDLYTIQSRVENITGHKSYIMRFPGGSSNTVSKSYDGGTRIMSHLTKEVTNRGFRYFDWNVSSGDAGGTTSSDGVYNNVVNNLKPGISIVLQHDTKKFSIDAVSRIIEYGLNNGYTFDKITENTPMITHGVNN